MNHRDAALELNDLNFFSSSAPYELFEIWDGFRTMSFNNNFLYSQNYFWQKSSLFQSFIGQQILVVFYSFVFWINPEENLMIVWPFRFVTLTWTLFFFRVKHTMQQYLVVVGEVLLIIFGVRRRKKNFLRLEEQSFCDSKNKVSRSRRS